MMKYIVNYFKTAIGTCQLIGTELREKLVSIRDKLVSVRDRVNKANEHVRFSREEQKSLKRFRAGITHFRKTLVIILGIPPMKLWYALLMRANKPETAVQSSTSFFSLGVFFMCMHWQDIGACWLHCCGPIRCQYFEFGFWLVLEKPCGDESH